MKNLIIAALLGIPVAAGCQEISHEAELTVSRDAGEPGVPAEPNPPATTSHLAHLVWFHLKPDADVDSLVREIRKLKEIKVVKNLKVYQFQDLGDSRAMSDLKIMMQMEFDSQEQYQTYQQHPVHLKLKQHVGDVLAAAPVTWDGWQK